VLLNALRTGGIVLLTTAWMTFPWLSRGRPAAAQEITVRSAAREIQVPADGIRHHAAVITAIALQPNGSLVAAAGDDHVIRLWNMRDGQLVRRLTGHVDWIRALEFSPAGATLISAGNDGQVLAWDASTGTERAKLAAHGQAVEALAISHDGRWMVTAGFQDPIRIYALGIGTMLREIECPCRDIRALVISADDRYWAAGGRDGVTRVWDAAMGRMIAHAAAHRRRIRAMAFTAGGTQLVSAGEDRQIRVWNWQAGDAAFSLPINAKILSIALCDGTTIAAGCSDNVIRLWDRATRQPIGTLAGHTGSVAALAYRDGILVSGGYDTVLRFWPLPATADATVRSASRARLPE